MERSPEEIAEIERHKYFLSEKAGHDVGWEHAVGDWDARWREKWLLDQGPVADASVEQGRDPVGSVRASASTATPPAEAALEDSDDENSSAGLGDRVKAFIAKVFAS